MLEIELCPRPSFEELYEVARAHLPDRLRLLKVPAEDIGDVLHEVVLIAHDKLDGLSLDHELDPRAGLRAWLSGIAWRYVARRRVRAFRRLELPSGDALQTVETADAPTSEQLAAETQRRELLRRVLDTLRPERAEVLVMHSIFQMPVPDIAGELSLNENTVKSRLARARRDAIAAVKRLRPDERSALQGSPAILPLVLDGTLDIAPEEPRWTGPGILRGSSVALLGGTFALGLAAGIQVGARRPDPPEPAPVVAVRDVEPAAPETSTAPVVSMPVPLTASAASRPAPFPRPPAKSGDTPEPPAKSGDTPEPPAMDTMARERDMLREARRAVHEGELDRALSILGSLDREIPQGALKTERTLLLREVARRRGGEAGR